MKSNSPFRKTDPPGSEEKPGILDKIKNIAIESAKNIIPGYSLPGYSLASTISSRFKFSKKSVG